MPVIRDVPLSLRSGEVLRREGFRGQSKVRPEIKSLIEELLTSVEDSHLLTNIWGTIKGSHVPPQSMILTKNA